MANKWLCAMLFLLVCSSAAWCQIEPIPNLAVQPVPLPGGDIIPGYGLFNQFLPGPPNQTPPFDLINADPHGITNFRGVTAMGYTLGTATDNLGNAYAVVTDIVFTRENMKEPKSQTPTVPDTQSRRGRLGLLSKYESISGTSV
jgi:hypothetical protein